MGRKQTKRQQRRAKKEGEKKKKNTATEENEEEVQNRNGRNDDDKDGGEALSNEDKDVQNRIEHAKNYRKKTGTEKDEENDIKIDGIDDRNDYPTSDEYIRALELYSNLGINFANDTREAMNLNFHLAVEYGCVRSMCDLASSFNECVSDGSKMHVATPWLLEGAIRGSGLCRLRLVTSLRKAKPLSPEALCAYWLKIYAKFNTYNESQFDNSMVKEFENNVGKSCVMCSKTDSKTLVLQQCKGCSLYCYCSEACQTHHWHQYYHRGECKQLHILNKYHKPYAKEIRDAAISGNNHPALDKLRYKLGLSRPRHEYDQLFYLSTHDWKPIDPKEYLVGRDDGTVWVGSTPDPIGSYEKNASSKNGSTDYCVQGDG